LHRRGVFRVAFSYALIAWLLLQISDVVLEPLGAPTWAMRALIALVIAGFPVALLLAWFFELTPSDIKRDHFAPGARRSPVEGIRRYADALVIGVLALTVAFLLMRQTGLLDPAESRPVIGVLPFTELGGANGSYLGDGFADALTYKLGRLEQLVVLAPSSTFEFRGPGLNLNSIGAKLNATALLEGTVRTGAGMLRISTRLVDIGSGRQLWSASYDRSSADIFAVQDEIASAVTQALSVALSLEDENLLEHNPTLNLTAYDAYLLGRERLARREFEAMQEAVSFFRQAVDSDPEYALAFAALAEALYLQISYESWRTSWDVIGPQAHQAAASAVALDPRLGEAYLAQALAAMGDNQQGQANTWPDSYISTLLKKAVELSPSNANALKFYSHYVEPADKVAVLERAAQLDPRSAIIRHNLGENYQQRGEYELAESWFLRAAHAQDPPFITAYKGIVELHIYGTQRFDDAARWAQAISRIHPNEWRIDVAATRAFVELGAWEACKELLDSLPVEPESARDKPFLWVQTLEASKLALAQGEFESAQSQAARFSRLFLETTPAWPDLSALSGPWTSVLDIQALAEVRKGQASIALARYRSALPDPATWYVDNFANMALRTPVIVASLKRELGETGPAEVSLRKLLHDIADKPIAGSNGIGFTRFTIHAFLGDTDAAIAALEEALAAGWLSGWWGLRLGEFDANYARVVADPRFETIYGQIEGRVMRMRENYLANPELSAKYLSQLQ